MNVSHQVVLSARRADANGIPEPIGDSTVGCPGCADLDPAAPGASQWRDLPSLILQPLAQDILMSRLEKPPGMGADLAGRGPHLLDVRGKYRILG